MDDLKDKTWEEYLGDDVEHTRWEIVPIEEHPRDPHAVSFAAVSTEEYGSADAKKEISVADSRPAHREIDSSHSGAESHLG